MNVTITHAASDGGVPWDHLIDLAPHLLWALVLLLILRAVGVDHLRRAVSRIEKVSIAGVVELGLKAGIDRAAAEKDVTLPRAVRDRVAERLQRLRPLLDGARILWIDDNPDNNAAEAAVLRHLGATVAQARTNEEARRHLRRDRFDLVLSDLARGADSEAGLAFLREIRSDPGLRDLPVIFYVGEARPELGVPAQAFGLTDRPDELFHLILDALERQGG